MNSRRAFLHRFPRLRSGARLARFVLDEAWFAGWVRMAPRRFMERAQRDRTWNFEHPAGQAWHAHVVKVLEGILGDAPWGTAFEVGCSEGFFTARLAPRCTHVTAGDLSVLALKRTASRCMPWPHVTTCEFDLTHDAPPEPVDVLVVMDVLSCLRGRRVVAAALQRLVRSIRPGGVLVYSDNSMPIDVRQRWGTERWWQRALGVMRPEDCVSLLTQDHQLTAVYAAPYRTPAWDRDQYLAILRRPPAPAASERE